MPVHAVTMAAVTIDWARELLRPTVLAERISSRATTSCLSLAWPEPQTMRLNRAAGVKDLFEEAP